MYYNVIASIWRGAYRIMSENILYQIWISPDDELFLPYLYILHPGILRILKHFLDVSLLS